MRAENSQVIYSESTKIIAINDNEDDDNNKKNSCAGWLLGLQGLTCDCISQLGFALPC